MTAAMDGGGALAWLPAVAPAPLAGVLLAPALSHQATRVLQLVQVFNKLLGEALPSREHRHVRWNMPEASPAGLKSWCSCFRHVGSVAKKGEVGCGRRHREGVTSSAVEARGAVGRVAAEAAAECGQRSQNAAEIGRGARGGAAALRDCTVRHCACHTQSTPCCASEYTH